MKKKTWKVFWEQVLIASTCTLVKSLMKKISWRFLFTYLDQKISSGICGEINQFPSGVNENN